MAQRKTLTEQQVHVLRWIGDGCPAGVMPDTHHRINAAALRRRGLVTIAGKGDSWSAKLTKAGREYLGAVDGPNPPIPRRPNEPVNDGIVSEILQAGGILKVPGRRSDADGVELVRRARIAQEQGELPEGKWLICVGTGDGKELRPIDRTQELGPYFGQLVPIEIPERVGRYHPKVRRIRDNKARHEVSRAEVPRMVKIVQAIVVEAERRGWSVEIPPEPTDRFDNDWTAGKDGHLILKTRTTENRLRFQEKGVELRGPWDRQIQAYRESTNYWSSYRPEGHYDTNATGELHIHLIEGNYWSQNGRQHRWSDRKSWRIEERLPHLFREIEARAEHRARDKEEKRIETEEEAERERQAAEARRVQWEKHLESARRQLLETQRAGELRDQMSRWTEAKSLRGYRQEMSERFGDNPDTKRWLEWIDEFIEELDPLTSPPVLPRRARESVELLQPFMPERWSAQDPELVFDPEYGHRRPSRYR